MPEGDHRTLITDDGARLATLVVGPSGGPTVVLAHCWMGGMSLWGAVARRLVESGCRVVLWDQRGHGDSTLGDEAPNIARLGDDLLQILLDLDLRDVVLAGHSMGGMTIQAFAGQHVETLNERVRGVVLVATAAQPGWLRVPGPISQAFLGDRRTPWLTKQAAKSDGTSTDPHAHPDSVRAMNDAMLAATGTARAGFLTAMGRMDLRPGLANITVPTTIIVGTNDRLTPPVRARELHGGIAGSDLLVLDGYAHMLPYEAPDTIVSAVRAMLEHDALGFE
jgi:pimeloyl-ACP methyl ester carboxylesterase